MLIALEVNNLTPMLYEELEVEEWRPVVGYEDRYKVSSWGRVLTLMGGHIMKQRTHHRGYPIVTLSGGTDTRTKSRKVHMHFVHRLVAEAFLGSSAGMVVHHLDHTRTNNCIYNLTYVTNRENICIAARAGRLGKKGESNGRSKLTEELVREIRALDGVLGKRKVAKRFEIDPHTVVRVWRRRTWKHV